MRVCDVRALEEMSTNIAKDLHLNARWRRRRQGGRIAANLGLRSPAVAASTVEGAVALSAVQSRDRVSYGSMSSS